MNKSRGKPVAVLTHNRVMALDPQTYQAMLERLDDLDLIEIIKSRAGEVGVPAKVEYL